jgi:hypothetical protein
MEIGGNEVSEKRQSLKAARQYVEQAMLELYKIRLSRAITEEQKAECRKEYDLAFATVGCIFADTARAFADESRAQSTK